MWSGPIKQTTKIPINKNKANKSMDIIQNISGFHCCVHLEIEICWNVLNIKLVFYKVAGNTIEINAT
jgi:hypothetical protein